MLLNSSLHSIDSLYFDFSSPRYESGVQLKEEKEQIRFFLKTCSKNLIVSVCSYGAQAPFTAIRFKQGALILDGNKRLAILKALQDPALREEFGLQLINPCTEVRVEIYESKRSALGVVLKRNLPEDNAYLHWSMKELRNFMHICFDQEGSIKELGKLLEMDERQLSSMVASVNFFKKVKVDEKALTIQKNFQQISAFLISDEFKKETSFYFDSSLSANIEDDKKETAAKKVSAFLDSLNEKKNTEPKSPEPKAEPVKKLKLKESLKNRKRQITDWATSLKAPVAASVIFHIALFFLMAIFIVTRYSEKKKELQVTIADKVSELTLDVPKPEEIKEPEVDKISSESLKAESINLNEVLSTKTDENDLEAETAEEFDKVSTEVPVKNISISVGSGGRSALSNRSFVGKTKAVSEYGGSAAGQDRLIKALEWLKINQNPDGSWCETNRHSMTGLATLAFLAYGVDGNSKRYGRTVVRALKWLVSEAENTDTMLGRSGYEHAIVTFCLAEACCLISKQELRYAMEKCLNLIVDGQNSDGGFDYDYTGEGSSILTLSGWNCLALKAAKTSGSDNAKLPNAIYALAKFFKERQQDSGFCYRDGFLGDNSGGCGIGSARGIGVLGLQVLGEGKAKEVIAPLKAMLTEDSKKLNWKNDEPLPLYSWYYMTQAMFNAGGNYWAAWKNRFQNVLIQNQHRDGFWDHPPNSQFSSAVPEDNAKVFNTSLGCLMLTVFYRYLPMYKQFPDENSAKEMQEHEKEEGLDLILE